MTETNDLPEIRQFRDFIGYGVSADGRVWYLQKATRRRPYREWKEMTPQRTRTGHYYIQFKKEGKPYTFSVHRLIIKTFGPPQPPGTECCHNDGNSSNNHVDNLRWDTHQANMDDMKRHGTGAKGEKSWSAKLTEAQVIEARQLAANGVQFKDIAKRFGIDEAQMSRVIRGEYWSHLPGAIPSKRKKPARIPEHEMPRVLELVEAGYLQAEIGEMYGVDSATVSRTLKRHRERQQQAMTV